MGRQSRLVVSDHDQIDMVLHAIIPFQVSLGLLGARDGLFAAGRSDQLRSDQACSRSSLAGLGWGSQGRMRLLGRTVYIMVFPKSIATLL